MQLRELRDYAARRGIESMWTPGGAGAQASRAELDRLEPDARVRHFDAVLVWKLDGWGPQRGPLRPQH